MKIAAMAAAHEIQVAPHNFYGHLSTMMVAQFAAAVPHLRIMETDIDRIPLDDELFTVGHDQGALVDVATGHPQSNS